MTRTTTETKATDYKGFGIFARVTKSMREWCGEMREFVTTDYIVKNTAGEWTGCTYADIKTAKAQCTKMAKRKVEKHNYMA